MKHPELLLPCGNIEMAQAAIHNGADAVYIGMPGFNARGRSADLTFSELKQLLDLCHSYAVKVYLAANILIFEEELAIAKKLLLEFLPLGFDAIIVQDLGLMKLIKQIVPKQRIHVSTQASISNFEAIKELEAVGIERVVLARENSLAEIKQIKQNTNIEIEVFVHGALCVAFSGQCFTSEVQGGRSANRGQCAQSCRLPYEVFVDGQQKTVRGQGYVVSPQDLCGLNQVEELIQLGVESFKVEGRLKSANYVASTAQAYHHKIHSYAISNETNIISVKSNFPIGQPALQQVYSRGFYSGWLNGVSHQKLVPANYSANQGLAIGNVVSVNGNVIEVKILKSNSSIEPVQNSSIEPGDGVLIDNPKSLEVDLLSLNKNHQIGSQVFAVAKTKDKNKIKLILDRKINLKRVKKGAIVFHNSNQRLNKQLENSYHNSENLKKLPLEITITANLDEPLKIIARIIPVNNYLCQKDYCITMHSEDRLQPAKSISLSKEVVLKELNRLDRSQFTIDCCVGEIPNGLYLSQKNIKKLRQNMVEMLHQMLISTSAVMEKHHSIEKIGLSLQPSLVGEIPNSNDQQEASVMEKHNYNEAKSANKKTYLTLLLRSPEQISILPQIKDLTNENVEVSQVILDFEFGKEYAQGIEQIKILGFEAGIATTRILKPKEYYNLQKIVRAQPNFVLVRNLGSLSFFRDHCITMHGDFSLNVTNSITAKYLLGLGLSRLTASYDLNAQQVSDLLQNSDVDFEVTIHQYMPEFHMEHCVFAGFLSRGNSYKDCGRPCEKHDLKLHDPYGNVHSLKADMECRNTMYTTKPQAAFEFLSAWQAGGCSHFRIEALDEKPLVLYQKIANYFQYFSGDISSNDLSGKLQINEKYGLAKSNYDHSHKYKSIKK